MLVVRGVGYLAVRNDFIPSFQLLIIMVLVSISISISISIGIRR